MLKRLVHRLKWWYRDRYVIPREDLAHAERVLTELIDIVQDDWEDPLQWDDLPAKVRRMKDEIGKQ